ncbi:MAG: hypothetical protein RIT81_21160 [Deltaproteobacteria bacterium]
MRRALFTLLALTACKTAPMNPAATSDHAPRPFTAEQIRDATPQGTTWTYEMRKLREPPVRQVTRVVAADDARVTFAVDSFNAGGEALGGTKTSTATWTELEAHATFPAAHTKILDVEVDTPAGRFEAWRYEVRDPDAKVVRIKNFYFAKSRPGAPVLYEQTDDGEIQFRMVLVESK